MASGDLHRDRGRRQRGVRAYRPRGTRTRLVHVATANLGALAALFAASWVILAAGGAWVSAVLLVAVPHRAPSRVRVHRRASGRLLDVRQMKIFPRVVTGFAVGFFVGGAARDTAPRARFDREPAARDDRGTTHVPRAPARDRAALPGSACDGRRAPAVARPPLRTLFASGLLCCCSPTRCCPRWVRRWSTSCSSTGPRHAIPPRS